MKFFTLAIAALIAFAATPVSSDLAAQETSAVAKKDASEPSHRSLAEARIRKQLNKPVDLIYDAEPFGDVLAALSQDLGINIVVDQNLEGVLDGATEVSSNLAGVQLSNGLRLMLRAVDATYTIRDGVLLLISIEKEGEPEFLVRRMVDVRELLESIKLAEPNRMGMKISIFGNYGVSTAESEAADNVRPEVTPEHLLVQTILNAVSPDSWEQNGMGNCVVQCIGGVLVIRATEAVADDVLDFLKDLQHQIGKRGE